MTPEQLDGFLGYTTYRLPMSADRLEVCRRQIDRATCDADDVGSDVARDLLTEVDRLRAAAAGADTLIRGVHADGTDLGHVREFTLTHEGAAMLVKRLTDDATTAERERCAAIVIREFGGAVDPVYGERLVARIRGGS